MTTYRVMAKAKYGKRFQCLGHHDDSKFAENNAISLSKSLWTREVKIIVTDDNGITNEIFYKRGE